MICVIQFQNATHAHQEVLMEVIDIIQEERAALIRFDCF